MAIKNNVLFALASKLEEEGVVTPTVEAEVSASVEVTPEQQEAIDEEVTQIEEIATISEEVEEAATEVEEVEEAEATLRAIADNLRTYGQLPQQMYDFLQKTGYLDVIATAQSTSMNRVQYPAVESINPTALNRQVVDGIIAGCEGMLANVGKWISDHVVAIWRKIVQFVERVVAYFTASKEKVESLGKQLSEIKAGSTVDLKDTVYPTAYFKFNEMKEFDNRTKRIMPSLSRIQEQFDKLSFTESIKAEFVLPQEIQELIGKERGKAGLTLGGNTWSKEAANRTEKDTVAGAGFTLENLKAGGAAYQMAHNAAEHNKTLQSILPKVRKMVEKIQKEAQKNSRDIAAKEGASTTQQIKNWWNDFANHSTAYSRALLYIEKNNMIVVRSYVAAASAALRAVKAPEEKKNIYTNK